jgi:hypothetical protein
MVNKLTNNKEDIKAVMDAVDKSGDGKIQWKEFREWFNSSKVNK